MDRRCFRFVVGRGRRIVRRGREFAEPRAYRFLEAGRCLAGRCGQRNPTGRNDAECEQERDDRGHGVRFAGAGAARHHAEPPAQRRSSRGPLQVIGRRIGKESVERRAEPGRFGHVRLCEPAQPGRDRLLRAPETREIQSALPIEHERTRVLVSGAGDRGARLQRAFPRRRIRKRRPVRGRPIPPGNVRQAQTHMAGPGGLAGERPGQRQFRAAASVEFRDQSPEMDVDVGEIAPFPQAVQHGGAARHYAPLPRKQSSSARKHPAEGRSPYTPRVTPAPGSMPRTKR